MADILNPSPLLPQDEYLAINLGRDDGLEAVNECLAERGRQAILDGVAEMDRGGLNPWEEAAASAGVHSVHRDAAWDDVSRPLYYRAYHTASAFRAREIAAEQPTD